MYNYEKLHLLRGIITHASLKIQYISALSVETNKHVLRFTY